MYKAIFFVFLFFIFGLAQVNAGTWSIWIKLWSAGNCFGASVPFWTSGVSWSCGSGTHKYKVENGTCNSSGEIKYDVYEQTCIQSATSIDGEWTNWSPWSSCASGTQTRTRSCTNPSPSWAGKPCSWDSSESQSCNVPLDGICWLTNGCSRGAYIAKADTTTEYKWSCSGLFWGNTTSCTQPIKFNGVCSTTKNTCIKWTVIDQSITASHFHWKCTWNSGWTTTSCSVWKPVNAECTSIKNTCTLEWQTGHFSPLTYYETSTEYHWSCWGLSGGNNINCKMPKPVTTAPLVTTTLKIWSGWSACVGAYNPVPTSADLWQERHTKCNPGDGTGIYNTCTGSDYKQETRKCATTTTTTSPVVHAQCSTVVNQCISGSYNGDTDPYKWQCLWSWGGNNKNCSIPAPVLLPAWPSWSTTVEAWSATQSTPSWVFTTEYTVKWCTPTDKSKMTSYHQSQLDWDDCYVGKLTPTWNLPEGWVSGASLLTSLTDWDIFRLKGQGLIDITATVIDRAWNASTKNFSYKIDKTAPSFGGQNSLNGINLFENSPYIHAIEEINIPGTLLKRNQVHVNQSWNINGILEQPNHTTWVASNNAQIRNYLDENMKMIRYKGGINHSLHQITMEVPYDDTWGKSNTNINTLVSWNNKVEFFQLWGSVINTFSTDMTTGLGGLAPGPDSWNVYIVRVYDNAWNYTEEPLYIYRDETAIDASKIQLTFEWDDSDVVLNNQESRFILANNDVKINYDWGTTFDTNDHMPTGIKMYVEKHDDITSSVFENMSSSSTGTTQGYNLSLVDNDLENHTTWENYREYSVRFETPTFSGNQICDAVWNCISWESVLKNLRVVAAPISLDKSSMQVSLSSTNGKIFADNKDYYEVSYVLKDKYNNAIRQVTHNGQQITDYQVKVDFLNTLDQVHSNFLSGFRTINAVKTTVINWNDIITWTANSTGWNKKINLKEANKDSNGIIDFTISSKVPTAQWYRYMKDTAKLEIKGIENIVNYHSWNAYKAWYISADDDVDFSEDIWKYNWMISKIQEDETNTYNTIIPVDYGEVTLPIWLSTGLELKKLSDWKGRVNFEFSSPILYFTEDFNTLRDGVFTNHIKKVKKIKPVDDYSIWDRYFDLWYMTFDTFQNTLFTILYNGIIYDVYRWNTISWSQIEKPGTHNEGNNSNTTINTFWKPGGPPALNMSLEWSWSTVWVKYEVRSDKWFTDWWYVSYIRYKVWWEDVFIPSISRSVTHWWSRYKASANFPDVTTATWAKVNSLTSDLSVNGLVNDIQWWAHADVGDQDGLVSLEMSQPYTRAELIKRVKKKVFSASRGLDWCTDASVNITNPDPNCTITIEEEQISFYDASVYNTLDIDCGVSCLIDGQRQSLIVKNGRVNILSDINTMWDGQLFIASLTEKWVSNIEIINDQTSHDKQLWWIGIHEKVTNIDAFLLAQWALVTLATNTNLINLSYTNPDLLLNQLHIYGSVFSLNTIWWAKTGDCPYIETWNCAWRSDTSKIYDLSFLRRFSLVDASWFGGSSWALVPYSPELNLSGSLKTTAKSSWWYVYDRDGDPSSWNGSVRYNNLTEEQKKASVIIERDHRWSITPSYFSKD